MAKKINYIELLKHLPKTNCKECGEISCMAFAVKLAKHEATLADCKPLFQGDYENERKELERLIEEYGLKAA